MCCESVCVWVYVCWHIYVCMYVFACVCVWTCSSECVCVVMSVCLCVCGYDVTNRGRTYAKKLHFLRKKRAGYANLKMPYVYCTQKTVTSHIKMCLVISFFAPTREGL